jgi:uncharacterized protein (TIGR02996 family)
MKAQKDEDSFVSAIRASPKDEELRLVFADWLEDRGDPRADYLRAEVEHFRNQREVQGSVVWSLMERLDPVWTAMVSRAPFGILVPDLTFSETGPKVQLTDLKKIEKRWRKRLLPDYAAFLLSYNGGRPSKPYLYSYMGSGDDIDRLYDEVRFFSTVDKHPSGRPYLMMNAVELYDGHISERQDEQRLRRMLPIGKIIRDGDDAEGILALLMDKNEKYNRIIELVYWGHSGLSEDEPIHPTETFVGLLMQLCDACDVPED